MHKCYLFFLMIGAATLPLRGQCDIKADVVKHLRTSRDFTLQVAEAMPAGNYDFKLTPPQMSFAEQMVHLSQGLTYFLSTFSGEKPNPPKPLSMKKDDVIAFIKTSFIKRVTRFPA
jgi:hypothetical protein